jgi:DNA-binding NarL/FixJ family response regulator
MDENDELMKLLDEATVEPNRWPVALARFAAAMKGAGAHLVVVDKYTDGELKPSPRFKTIGVLGLAADVAVRYMEGWRDQDPLLSLAFDAAGPPGTILQCQDFLTDEFVKRSAYFQEFLIPAGGRYQTGITLANDANQVIALDLHTRHSPASLERLQRLQPALAHFRHSVALSAQLAIPLARGELLKQALDFLGIACVVLDERMRVVDSSPAAAAMLEEGKIIREDAAGRLSLNHPMGTALLVAAVASACTGGHGNAFRLPAPRPSTTVRVVPAGVTRDNPFASQLSNCALVFIETIEEPPIASLSQIQKRFQCSRAEASVARALALGFSPQEVADQRGSSIYTTRAQIRVLLQLSASHRIAELVAKILHLGNERERVGQSD